MREVFWIWNIKQLLNQWYQRSSQQNGIWQNYHDLPMTFLKTLIHVRMKVAFFPPSELGRIPFRTVYWLTSSLDFIVLIYLVWKLSPRETIPLEDSLSFKRTPQLSASLMTMSITIVLSSFSEWLFLREVQLGGWFLWNLIFPFPILQCPRSVLEEAFHFHALESIHQALPFSISKVYLQVNSNNRCRNWSFLCQGLRKKILS